MVWIFTDYGDTEWAITDSKIKRIEYYNLVIGHGKWMHGIGYQNPAIWVC